MTNLTDTHPEIQEIMVQLLRQAPVWRKLELMGELNKTARILILSGLRERYPLATEPELQRHLADILLGTDIALRVFGPHLDSGTSSNGD